MQLTVKVTQEQANMLQRLGMEMECRYDIVARIIENHKGDPDDAVLSSSAFESYHKQAAEAKLSYEVAKAKFGDDVLRPEVEKACKREDVAFTWSIPDFSRLEAIVDADD